MRKSRKILTSITHNDEPKETIIPYHAYEKSLLKRINNFGREVAAQLSFCSNNKINNALGRGKVTVYVYTLPTA